MNVKTLRDNSTYVYHDCDCNITLLESCRFDIAEELADLHVYIKLFYKESTTPLKKVTKRSTVCNV